MNYFFGRRRIWNPRARLLLAREVPVSGDTIHNIVILCFDRSRPALDRQEIHLTQEYVAYVPGDSVSFEIKEVVHEMHLTEIRATFTEEIPADMARDASTIVLEGIPEKKPGHKVTLRSGEPILRLSQVTLSAEIPKKPTPGEYRCTELVGETYGGQTIPFDQAEQAAWQNWRFQVVEEPNTPLRVRIPWP